MKLLLALATLGLLVQHIAADCYMHNPRGGNDRLNEAGTDRDNDNRLWDSQNNAKGGYCWGEPLTFYGGSMLPIEWTNQHTCGHNTVCNMVIQYMCDNTGQVRDGYTTNTIPDDPDNYQTLRKDTDSPYGGPGLYRYGMHEDYWYYQNCKTRERNKGLFIADRQLGGNSAIFTRQNNNGDRHGFECVEERDYYPYWHPTPWKDIAVLVSDTGMCSYFRSQSQNGREKGNCTDPHYNNELACTSHGGTWEMVGSWGIAKPDCVQIPFTRDNHLGNSITGYPLTYNWTLPDVDCDRAVLRIRYNISTLDYDGWSSTIDSTYNGAASPVKNNPTVAVGENADRVTLALNTAQYGRTFQDRTHVFSIKPRPDFIPSDARIWNLNVRGKRGNIVQVYPAVEYDFVPQRLIIRQGDFVHFQWTGCDTNPAGNAGEGRDQTDRSNIVEARDDQYNYPVNGSLFETDWLVSRMAYLSQTGCYTDDQLNTAKDNNGNAIDPTQNIYNCKKLNAAPRMFSQVAAINNSGEWNYISSRNNNFSNRSQKGRLISLPLMTTWAIVLCTLGGVAMLGAAGAGVGHLYTRKHPESRLSTFFAKV